MIISLFQGSQITKHFTGWDSMDPADIRCHFTNRSFCLGDGY